MRVISYSTATVPITTTSESNCSNSIACTESTIELLRSIALDCGFCLAVSNAWPAINHRKQESICTELGQSSGKRNFLAMNSIDT
jgi:hypothetical protein